MNGEREALLRRLGEAIRFTGMGRDEFDQIKDKLVDTGLSAGEFVRLHVGAGYAKWEGDRLVPDLSDLSLKLDPETERQLREVVAQTRQPAAWLALGLIREALSRGLIGEAYLSRSETKE